MKKISNKNVMLFTLIVILGGVLMATNVVAECSVTNKKGQVIYYCKEKEGKICEITYLGNTLTCDGVRVKLDENGQEIPEGETNNDPLMP